MNSLPNESIPKPPLLTRIFNLIPSWGPLAKIKSLVSAVWRVGGPIQAFRLAIQVIRKTGFRSVLKLLSNSAVAYTQGIQLPYETWAKRFLDLSESEIESLKRRISELSQCPKISILMPTFNAPPKFFDLAITSVRNQIYQNWELCIADDASTDESFRNRIIEAAKLDSRIKYIFRGENGRISEATNSCLNLATGEYVAFLDHDDELTIDALAVMAIYADANPDVDFFYSDEDKIDTTGNRFSPHFKPSLNRTLALGMNYFCHLTMYRTSKVKDIGGLDSEFDGAQDYELSLRMLRSLKDSQIMHVPYILYHWRILPTSTSSSVNSKPYAIDAGRRAVSEHLARSGVSAKVEPNPILQTLNQVSPVLLTAPKVSIIIPTRDQSKILETCVDSILKKTSYSNFEIIIVNNGSIEQGTFELFKRIRSDKIQILDYPQPFNYSKINNFAVDHATGEFLCLLNNDIEVLTHDWLEQLLGFAQLPQTGAVGAKLLYPNGSIQHAGVILGIGGLSSIAGHSHRLFPQDSPGYMGRAIMTQEFSAVTGACLMVSKSKYLEVGGLTEELTVGFNDVDFCLKLLKCGFKNVFVPHAKLIHHESLSRGADITKEQRLRASGETVYMLVNWPDLFDNDPAYNRHLSSELYDFSLAWPPRKSNGVY